MRSDQRGYSPYFLALSGAFVTSLIVANIIAVKIVLIGPLVLPAGIIIFPLSYLFGDVLTEVYGYSATRRVIWLGFACNLLAVIAIVIGEALPPAPFWDRQAAYASILGFAPRLLLASFIAYLVGEFANSYVMARMKITTNGRMLWARAIGSTFVGEGLDSAIFITIAFAGTGAPIVDLVLAQWLVKVLYEVVAMPFTYAIVGFLKRAEALDTYDFHTNFNPVRLGD